MTCGRLVAVLALLLATAPAFGDDDKPFDPEACALETTHVVVVTEGEKIDGDVEVLESWQGDLKTGDRISVADLAEFEHEDTRAVNEDPSSPSVKEPPRTVTGRRMVLFLRRASGTTPGDSTWVATSDARDMRHSIAWIEGEEVLAFATSEGTLSPCDKASSLRAQVATLLADRLVIERALGSLRPEGVTYVDAIAASGSAALPILRGLVTNAEVGIPRALADSFLAIDRDAASLAFVQRLTTELGFWQRIARPGAPDRTAGERAAIVRHEAVLRCLAEACAAQCDSRAEEVLSAILAVWQSCPELDESAEANVLEGLRGVIEQIAAGGEPTRARHHRTRAPGATRPGADAPLSTVDDERRVAELEATLAEELTAERARPPGRRVPLDGAIRIDPTDDEATASLVPAAQRGTPIALGPLLELARKHVAPNLRAQAGRGDALPASDVEAAWSRVWEPDSAAIRGARDALLLEAAHDLVDENPCAFCAADRALDAWAFEHDLRSDDLRVAHEDSNPGGLLAAAVSRIDRKSQLDEIDRKLSLLEATAPSLEDLFRRQRLANGCLFRAYRRGELKGPRSNVEDGWSNADATPLDHLSPRARLSDRRLGSIRREWERSDVRLRELERTAARFPNGWAPLRSLTAPGPSWLERLEVALDREARRAATDLSRIRLLRVLVGARRFWLEHGRWPRTTVEALGEALAAKLGDPLPRGNSLRPGAPFDLEVAADGSLSVSLSARAETGRFERLYRLPVVK